MCVCVRVRVRVCTCKQDSFGGVCSWLYSVAVAGAVVMMGAAAVMMGAAVVMMGAAAVMMGAAAGGPTVPRARCPACLLVGVSDEKYVRRPRDIFPTSLRLGLA